MGMILPPGFVINTSETYAEVASYDLVPLDKIYGYWRVYTTTHRKLVDPTARRLENFWWHVWGSDRHRLCGAQLARLFEDISTGPTFAALDGRARRSQASSLSNGTHISPGVGPQDIAPSSVTAHTDEAALEEDGSADNGGMKDLLSSSSKPPPTHSILKKPRGPSSSGPRPTARFASPPRSGDEGSKDSGVSSGSVTAVATEMDVPIKPQKKSTPPAVKKYVASTPASRRRPQLPRRQSSQLSSASDNSSREATSLSSMRSSGGQQSSTGTAGEYSPGLSALRKTSSRSSNGSSGSSSQSDRPALSSKAAGKRPMRVATDVAPVTHRLSPLAEKQVKPLVVQATPATQRDRRLQETRQAIPEYEVSKSNTKEARAGPGRNLAASAPLGQEPTPTGDIQPDENSPRPRELAGGRFPSQGLISSSVAATSKVDVRGTFDFEDPRSMLAGPTEANDLPDELSLASRPSSASLRSLMFTPTQPSATPPVPLGRSKSQLTLLLEREKDKLGGDLSRVVIRLSTMMGAARNNL